MKDDKKEEFLDLHKTYGDFIFENAGMGMQMNDGMYYHYSKVCELLKKYTHEKERRHVQLATDYKNQEEQNDSFRSKISHLEELLKAADEVIGDHPNIKVYEQALEKYNTLKNKQ